MALHPFYSALGDGPYRVVGFASMPSPVLAAHNPTAYNSALGELPRNLVNGRGSCAICGQGIMNVVIVTNGAGQRWGVGSDCALKADDPGISRGVKAHQAELRRTQRQARAQRRYALRMELERPEREARAKAWELARAEADARRNAAVQRRLDGLPAGFLDALRAKARGSDFHASLLSQLEQSGDLSPRQAVFAARVAGRAGSAAYEATYNALTD